MTGKRMKNTGETPIHFSRPTLTTYLFLQTPEHQAQAAGGHSTYPRVKCSHIYLLLLPTLA